MYSDDDLDAAAQAGILSDQNVRAFRDFVGRRHSTVPVDEEHFRLLTGFNDIFVAIAAVLMLVAANWLGKMVWPPLGPMLLAGCSWGLAEYFTRRRRMALPSIVLLLAFVGGVFLLGSALAKDVGGANYGMSMMVGAVAAGVAAYGHWRRFRVPITVAAGTLVVAGGAIAFLMDQLKTPDVWPAILACGIVIFAVAMAWDASDRSRSTRRSDVAFWLHLAAAPLIVHPVFSALGLLQGQASMVQAAVAVVLYLGLAVVALVVDRRALLVSALAYVLYAVATLLKGSVAVNFSFGLTALVLGSALLLLSASWHKARAVLVRRLPQSLQARLPVV